jgi:uncharacterized protein
MPAPIPFASVSGQTLALLPGMANRHGLVTGATGTGKTVSLQTLAEGFSRLGTPVFLADVKGDLAGLGMSGVKNEKLERHAQAHGLALPAFGAAPVALWDVFGEKGHPVRVTVSDLGPLLLSRMLSLNETQGGVLSLAFRIADDAGLLLLDFKDLRALLEHLGNNAKSFRTSYGNIAPASIGAIQRNLLDLESQGGVNLLGEPALDVADLLRTVEVNGQPRGVVNVLAADRLTSAPRVYSTFLLWLLAELYERLPEVGDVPQPRLVFFFDEAHLLFDEAPKALLEKIEQVVRLVRSKGVGIYFVSQSPLDLPDTVLGQLGHRVQHALRAFTPRDQKAVRAAAETLRPNPNLDAATAISELAVGEALVSFLDEVGRPRPVERAFVLPPGSRIGPVTEIERGVLIEASALKGKYDETIDRESAYERLKGRAPAAQEPQQQESEPRPLPPIAPRREVQQVQPLVPQEPQQPGVLDQVGSVAGDLFFGTTGPRGGHHPGLLDSFVKSAARGAGSTLGREVTRGLFGSLFGRR